ANTSLSKDDFTKETIRVEYEWRPPKCDTCKIFGHVHDYCPKKVVSPPIVATSNVVTPNAEKTNDGFQTIMPPRKAPRTRTTPATTTNTTSVTNAQLQAMIYKALLSLWQQVMLTEARMAKTTIIQERVSEGQNALLSLSALTDFLKSPNPYFSKALKELSN
ncbi:zinc knuckle CX2CX4HX4C containing protein, partial [Tanacetum coccineum]